MSTGGHPGGGGRFELGRVRLNPKGLRWHLRGHPWVFRDDLARVAAGRGYLVEVEDPWGRKLGLASFSPDSRIALRFLLRGAEAEIPDRTEFFRTRIQTARDRRKALAGETDALRLVSAEADGLPGLILDRYAEVLVLQSLTPFIEAHLDHIVPVLVDLFDPTMILSRGDLKVRELEGLPRRVELCHGRRIEEVEIREHGLSFRVDPFRGQKTGFYLDQRSARALVEERTREGGGRILDLFCYTGGFSLHAARGGAAEVLAVDSSEEALARLRRGMEENGLQGIRTRRGNVFEVSKDLVEDGRTFEGIILDPPAFARRKTEVEGALRGYRDLNRRALRLLAPGGWLLTCSCSANLRPEAFRSLLAQAARGVKVPVLDRGRLPPALDHPVLLHLPESDYLKVHLLESLEGEA